MYCTMRAQKPVEDPQAAAQQKQGLVITSSNIM
jgi:hypothetical protein